MKVESNASQSEPKADNGGLRYNKDKNRLELLPPEWEWALGDVTTQGSKKYEPRNWERGMAWSIMDGCMRRHRVKFAAGERYDPETGCHHLAMVAWNALALMSYDLRGAGIFDMPGAPAPLQLPDDPNLIAFGGMELLNMVNEKAVKAALAAAEKEFKNQQIRTALDGQRRSCRNSFCSCAAPER